MVRSVHLDFVSVLFELMMFQLLKHSSLTGCSSLERLRDEVRNLPCTYKSRHDAAADLIHIYAYTKCFFRIRVHLTAIVTPGI